MPGKQIFSFSSEIATKCLVGRQVLTALGAKDGDFVSTDSLYINCGTLTAVNARKQILAARNARYLKLVEADCTFLVCNQSKNESFKVCYPVDGVPWFTNLWNSYFSREPKIVNKDFVDRIAYIFEVMEQEMVINNYCKEKSLKALRTNMGMPVSASTRRGGMFYDAKIRH